jgi:hypothetical protein
MKERRRECPDDPGSSLPLDHTYNHHVVIFTQPSAATLEAAAADTGEKKRKNEPMTSVGAVGLGTLQSADALRARGLSAWLTPCGVGAYFTGVGPLHTL